MNINIDTDTAYDILDTISKKKEIELDDLKSLVYLSQCSDSEIKAYVAELLVIAKGTEAERTLIDLCNDEDELVRANACDSLSMFPSANSYSCLIKRILYDVSVLVKTYAILSIVDIVKYLTVDIDEVKSLLKANAEEINLRVACYKGLYVLGEDSSLEKLIVLLRSDNYHDRCAVLNALEDIIDEKNKTCILDAIKELHKTETSKAVKSIIARICN